MPQTTQIQPDSVFAENLAVAVPAAGNTDLLEIIVARVSVLGVEVLPTVQALDAFIVQGKFHQSGAYVTLFSLATDFTTPAGIVLDASGDLTIQAAGSTGWLVLDVSALYAVKIQASANVAGQATVTARANGRTL